MYIYIWDANLVITVPVDVPVPNGTKPSADTALTEKLDMFPFKFHWLSMILIPFYGPVMSSKMVDKIL